METIKTIAELEAIYNAEPTLASTAKVSRLITPEYASMIEQSPFVALATSGPEGLDCSPRGDEGQVVFLLDEKTVALPDRRGNHRIDTLRNIVNDPRVALLFLLPGSGTTLRINGKAELTTDPAICQRFEKQGRLPRCVMIIHVGEIYFQCARAVVRAGLWNPAKHLKPGDIPTPGEILQGMTAGGIDGCAYDAEWPGRGAQSLW